MSSYFFDIKKKTTMSLRLAILDMNNNVPNKGVGYLQLLVEKYPEIDEYQIFDVRAKNEVPDLSFDIYISTGGPGSPYDFGNGWDKPYFNLMDQIIDYNNKNECKKYVFFICHSFQIASIYFKIGNLIERPHMSFGIYPVDTTADTINDEFLNQLPNPFYVADFRYYQVANIDFKDFDERGFKLLATENKVSQVENLVAPMAIRFNNEMIGTQFHPEADAIGMIQYLKEDTRKENIIKEYGMKKYLDMVDHADDPDKIQLTHDIILPTFLNIAIENLKGVEV